MSDHADPAPRGASTATSSCASSWSIQYTRNDTRWPAAHFRVQAATRSRFPRPTPRPPSRRAVRRRGRAHPNSTRSPARSSLRTSSTSRSGRPRNITSRRHDRGAAAEAIGGSSRSAAPSSRPRASCSRPIACASARIRHGDAAKRWAIARDRELLADLEGEGAGERPYCLIDYFPKDFVCFIDESHRPCRRSAGCTRATVRASRRSSTTAFACQRAGQPAADLPGVPARSRPS